MQERLKIMKAIIFALEEKSNKNINKIEILSIAYDYSVIKDKAKIEKVFDDSFSWVLGN